MSPTSLRIAMVWTSEEKSQGQVAPSIVEIFSTASRLPSAHRCFPSRVYLGRTQGPTPQRKNTFSPWGITQQDPRYYPPSLSGMRGSHPGSFEAAHALRDGRSSTDANDTGERYDLIVVGGGIRRPGRGILLPQDRGSGSKNPRFSITTMILEATPNVTNFIPTTGSCLAMAARNRSKLRDVTARSPLGS